MRELTVDESKKILGGEAITISLVIAVLSISILTILVWKIYTSKEGSLQLPGGFKLQWGLKI